MKLQPFSDIHADVAPVKKITIGDDVGAVIVPGDTCEGALRAFERLREIVPLHVPIVMTVGNHEFYRRFIPDELALARSHGPTFNTHVLENNTITLSGVRPARERPLAGPTLWAGPRHFGEH